MPAVSLSLGEREEIRAGIERGETDSVIGRRVGRHRCTINEEINRNGGRAGYSAVEAQARAEAKRCRPKAPVFVADPVLAAHVTARLKAKDSPMTISKELARGVHGVTGSVSHECIYSAVYAHGRRGLPAGLHKGLHRQQRCRKHRRNAAEALAAPCPLGAFNPIAERPAVAEARTEVGHLEGDLILGSFNRSAIVTVFDRASRYLWLADLPEGHTAEAVLAALNEILDRIPPPLRRTLTWDQGREMARHVDLAEMTGIIVYFADPVRHEALMNRAVVKGHGCRLVAASRLKLRAA
jgi:transposase, IS30 family